MSGMSDKEIFETLRKQKDFRHLKHSLDPLLGDPVWWICQKPALRSKALKQSLHASSELWNDPHARTLSAARSLFRRIGTRPPTAPVSLPRRGDGAVYCLPLSASPERIVGYLLLTGLAREIPEKTRHLLNDYARLIVDNTVKNEELNRLSATIRPRAVALSTVHTVHRIINSTLNLDELVSRLAHLTAQVLRVHRCAIYLLDTAQSLNGASKSRKPSSLVCKALIGYPKSRTRDRRIPLGKEMEGRVAKSADIQLRKKILCIPLIDEDVIGVVTVTLKNTSPM